MENDATKKEAHIREAFSVWNEHMARLSETVTPEMLYEFSKHIVEEFNAEVERNSIEVPGTPFVEMQGSPSLAIMMMWYSSALNAMTILAIHWKLSVNRDELFEWMVRLTLFSRLETLSSDGVEQSAALAARQDPPGTSWPEAIEAFKAAWPRTREYAIAYRIKYRAS